MVTTDVAIVGAGPYGLSIAAHLRARGLDHRVFGDPLRFWLSHMPKGMLLKSDGFASNLYDPELRFTLRHFCDEEGIDYADLGTPVPLEVFIAYGLAFQGRFVPQLENKLLVSLERSGTSFDLRLDSGESLRARRVVLAIGIGHFRQMPPQLVKTPADLVSHSSDHSDLGAFKGRDVIVLGAGASASDLAVLLHESGASVRLITRRPSVPFHTKMQLPRPLTQRIRLPISPIGPGWRSRFFCDAPHVFRRLPAAVRLRLTKDFLGPAGGWFMRSRFTGIPALVGCKVERAEAEVDRIRLYLSFGDGEERQIISDHVIAATGYRVDLRRLGFLDDKIRASIRAVDNVPILSSNFESTVPGLYFVGPAAAYRFGPVMRFAAGAQFTAARLARHLGAATTNRGRSRPGVAAGVLLHTLTPRAEKD